MILFVSYLLSKLCFTEADVDLTLRMEISNKSNRHKLYWVTKADTVAMDVQELMTKYLELSKPYIR